MGCDLQRIGMNMHVSWAFSHQHSIKRGRLNKIETLASLESQLASWEPLTLLDGLRRHVPGPGGPPKAS